MPGVPQAPPPAAPVPRGGRSFRITFTEEQMARYRALGEEARRTSVVGHIAATNLPEFEVLEEWVLSTFPEAVRECSPSMLSNGWFEVKFTSSDAKDQALAGSPYDLAGAHWITLSPWRQSPDRDRESE